MKIEKLIDKKKIKDSITTILSSLPEWFGIAESIIEYANESMKFDTWSVSINDEVVGVIVFKINSSFAGEIFVVGIKKEYHRMGIGKELLRVVEKFAIAKNLEFLQVKTIGRSHKSKVYYLTRAFYEANGFKELETFDEIWGKKNPCMVMIKSLI